jgi:hypothetical protein
MLGTFCIFSSDGVFGNYRLVRVLVSAFVPHKR